MDRIFVGTAVAVGVGHAALVYCGVALGYGPVVLVPLLATLAAVASHRRTTSVARGAELGFVSVAFVTLPLGLALRYVVNPLLLRWADSVALAGFPVLAILGFLPALFVASLLGGAVGGWVRSRRAS